MEQRTLSEYMGNLKRLHSPYITTPKIQRDFYNKTSAQYPEGKMYINKSYKNRSNKVNETSEDVLDLLLSGKINEAKNKVVYNTTPQYTTTQDGTPREIALEKRHRYGDSVIIRKAKFIKSVEELEAEKFQLLLAARSCHRHVYLSCNTIPKQEKYVLGAELRGGATRLLVYSVRIKKKYYRKNLLEDMDIELEILRELYYSALIDYPDWMTRSLFDEINTELNRVGAIVGGLIKTAVC